MTTSPEQDLNQITTDYERDGVVLIRQLFNTDEVAAVHAELNADAPGKRELYFYVPRGTKIVGGFAKGAGRMLNGSGKVVHQFAAKPGYFSVAVPVGEDAALWQFANTGGQRVLLTVPPYLARSANELLLPREVVEKDSQAAAPRLLNK